MINNSNSYRDFIKQLANKSTCRANKLSLENLRDRTFSKNVVIYGSLPLSAALKNKDVYHAILSEDGEIQTHVSQVVKSIFVLAGEYRSSETGKIFKVGDKEDISKDQKHGLTSDYCIITIIAETDSNSF